MSNQFKQFNVGAYECWAIADSSFTTSSDYLYYNAPQPELTKALNTHHLQAQNIQVPVNNMVIRAGDELVLIDTGQGYYGGGQLTENMRLAGISPDEITLVILTHGHTDHIGGVLTENFEPFFPHARYVMSQVDWGYFTAESVLNAAAIANRRVGWTAIPQDEATVTAATLLSPVVREKLTLIEGSIQEILPGIKMVAAAGHTIGHTMVRVESEGDILLHIADLTVTPIHMEHPDWLIKADLATELVAPTRRKIFNELAQDKTLVFADHFSFPALGKVSPAKDAWTWDAMS